ncbi:MAG: hypothetical protein ABIW84_05120 [Ilumatobacteraceae bacterium]
MRLVRFLVLGALVMTGCATTIDPTVTEVPVIDTTTTLPAGPATELLPMLVTEAGRLSEIIGSRGKKNDQLLTITNLYDAVRPELADTNGVTAQRFDGAVELCKKATKFNRPADADKCFNNLTVLTTSYLAAQP